MTGELPSLPAIASLSPRPLVSPLWRARDEAMQCAQERGALADAPQPEAPVGKARSARGYDACAQCT